ncbi:MAG: BspA family leucine-rich repeat surface protein [Prevotella sp.]|nr:BspA family leucine-rich repeat surface protein [Prevotella sp.]
MKKKSTQFRWLVTMLLLVTAMAMPKMAWAQNQMYTELSSGTLTFKYGVKPTGGEGITVYDIPDVSSSPDWNSQASSITTVVFDESFKNARPTKCFGWFDGCTTLTTINGIENLNTENVTDMDYMFLNCSLLSTLDLSGFNTAKVMSMYMMFCNCSKLTTIYVSDDFTTSAVKQSDDMFTNCTSLVGAIKYESSKTNASYANTTNGYFSIKGSETKPKGAYVVYTDAIKTLTFKYGVKPTGGEGITVYDIPVDSSDPGWNSQASSITTVVFDDSFKDARPTKCYGWFSSCSSLTTINGIENLNTENVTVMDYMFNRCSSLSTLDLSGFNTAKVLQMDYMFYGCSELTAIYASSNFTTTAVSSSVNMFKDCTSLVGAVAYSSDKTNAEYANTTTGYFKNPGDYSAYAVFNSSNNSLTFKYDTNISQLAENEVLCTIKSDNQYQGWYNHRTSINKVVFEPSFASARPVTCYQWFFECSNLASIEGVEYLNTSEVKSMNKMFYSCTKITTLNLSNFETSQVTDMSNMFGACNALTTIYVSDKFTIDKVTSDDSMFGYCNKLKGASNYIFRNWNKNYANYHTGYFSYGINTVDDLKTFANKVNGTYTPAEGETATPYTAICAGLMANITLTDADNLPAIGSGGYSGTFDGCGHAISGLNFSSASPALFAQNSGTIKNLGIAEATIAESANGSLCQTNSGTIESCFFMGTATGSSQSAGGICQTNNGTITNCYYLADSETDEIEGTTYKTTAQFKSGEVCYLLNEGKTDGTQIWYQNLAAEGDTWPVCNNTGNNTVYYATLFCGGTSNAGNTYANTPKVKIDHDMTGDVSLNTTKHIYQNGCKREGCDYIGYYATSDGTVVANETSEGVFTADALTLVDAKTYDNQAVFTATDFKYTRTFSNTNWTTWYVPFELELTKDICDKYDFSRINNVHQYDDNGDGNADRTVVESFRQNAGVKLKANYPYLVRAKSESDYDMSLALENVSPALAEENSIYCQSVDYKYTFTGTYKSKEGGENDTDPYTLTTGGYWQHFSSLKPMRNYMTIQSLDASSASPALMRSILLSVIGEEDTTGIVKIYDEQRRASETYDLSGRRLPARSQRGLVIENGKVVFKK